MTLPRFVIAGTHSGVGKTTVSLGLMAALRCQGYTVQPYKVGPDYIDPGLHYAATGRYSHNLDCWLCPEQEIKSILTRHSNDAQVAVVEGVMGIYDGMRDQGELASTAQVSKIINAPVVLVVSGRGVGRSIAATVKGYIDFDPGVDIVGVIINQVGSDTHAELLRRAIEDEVRVPVLGVLGRYEQLEIPSRHLGLMPATEMNDLHNKLEQLGRVIEQNVNMNRLLVLASKAPPVKNKQNDVNQLVNEVRLAVARDEAFNFYYQDSLDYLEELGAELVYFSPIKDKTLPQADGIILGGGFPEVFLPDLSSNYLIKNAVKDFVMQGKPVYAECGGFMYLCETISDMDGKTYPGVGLVPGEVEMKNRLSALGYVNGTIQNNCLLGEKGDRIKGHEFHWSITSGIPEDISAYSLKGGRGQDGRLDGFTRDNVFCSYVHIHWRGNPNAARSFLMKCEQIKNE
ncbi:MAG: cobyrinate a,c-diamide synthase [Firmicutes bacterium]|nr:cobyrinate a,c-diamide synthase [Bacillota bacterium]